MDAEGCAGPSCRDMRIDSISLAVDVREPVAGSGADVCKEPPQGEGALHVHRDGDGP
jgi:hypothetical protein